MSYRRETFIEKCAKFLNIAQDNVIVINMEKGIFNNAIELSKKNGNALKWSDASFVKYYSTNARRLLANISYTSNANVLISKIKNGHIDPYSLVKLTREELNPDLWETLKSKNLEKIVVKEMAAEDGMFKCNKCKSMKTIYYQMQTRSADEPMTTYVTCTNCNTKWKC